MVHMRDSFTLSRMFILAALLFGGVVFFIGGGVQKPSEGLASSEHWVEPILKTSWQYYKNHFMVETQRVRSNHYKGTITEGQSYALLKAVWMNDPVTFQRVWLWTRANMRRPSDHLFGWRWGEDSHGVERLLETENATDADQDIAYALLLAGEQWNRPEYIEEGKAIIHDLWRFNVQRVHGKYYLNPGTWRAFQEDYLTLNPSYFAPYVYRAFARYDTQHALGWQALADNIYPTLEACSDLTANKLPPNWCSVDWDTGKIGWSDKQGEGARDFSYDAFRVFWRMAMDASEGSVEAKNYLATHTALLDAWQTKRYLPEGYHSDGSPRQSSKTSSGFALSALLAQNHISTPEPKNDKLLYQVTLAPFYHSEGYWLNSYNDFLHSVIWLHLYTVFRASS